MTVSVVMENDAWLATLIVGESLAIRRLRALIARVARSPLPVLITGPTGAGKELVAEGIHRLSGRAGALVATNVCALGESLFESALFGHVRGAFTGATNDTTGLVGEADRGTLFLDEIGALPLREQAKLLRVLETRCYRPVGASRDQMSDFRLLAATNEDLDDAVDGARFREDLRGRLGPLVLHVPSIADRRVDVPLLVRHFVDRVSPRTSIVVDDAAMAVLMSYEWRGNVRELRDVVSTLVVLGDGVRIGRSEVQAVLDRPSAMMSAERPAPMSAERAALAQLLDQCGWDTSRVAAERRIHRGTVYRRMRALGITVPNAARYSRYP
jgi:DNA-binding NtrC family response regulator